MASIKISELRPAGYELFQDSESFLNELNEQELAITGGHGDNINVSQVSVSIGVSIVSLSLVTRSQALVTASLNA